MDDPSITVRVAEVGIQVGDAWLVDGVSFACHQGEWTLLGGPSGSGKSTLLRAINGLRSPTRGCIWTLGSPIPGRTRRAGTRCLAADRDRTARGGAVRDQDGVPERRAGVAHRWGGPRLRSRPRHGMARAHAPGRQAARVPVQSVRGTVPTHRARPGPRSPASATADRRTDIGARPGSGARLPGSCEGGRRTGHHGGDVEPPRRRARRAVQSADPAAPGTDRGHRTSGRPDPEAESTRTWWANQHTARKQQGW